MDEPKVLVVSTEVMPYMPESEMSFLAFESAKLAFAGDMQTRIFMPRFGVVNERRHQLHEVIRLSGINLIINDIDVPLIIKVASIPKERMQVYFIDNDDYFKRKATYQDKEGKLFEDNDERLIFFTKGVMETVKKLNWDPDIIHLHGWMTSLIPLYLREYYKDGALFKGSKIITSLYNDSFDGHINTHLMEKIKYDEINANQITTVETPTFENLQKIAIENSDSVIITHPDVSAGVRSFIDDSGKKVLEHHGTEDFKEVYYNFYREHIQE